MLAFSLEFSEFLLVSNTSSLTLSVSGIFKVEPPAGRQFVRVTHASFVSLQEIVMLYLAVEYNENQLSAINIVGLAICLTGIVFHCVLKFYAIQSTRATAVHNGDAFPFLFRRREAGEPCRSHSQRTATST